MKLKHVGVSSIRLFTATRLRELKEPVILCDHSEPIAAMVPYALYLEWQRHVGAAPPAPEATRDRRLG